MTARGIFVALAAGALVAAGAAAMPLASQPASAKAGIARRAAANGPRPALAFTPAAADPRLAAVFARGGLETGGFRFTPTTAKHDGGAVTVVVRARSNHLDPAKLAAAAPVGLAPIAYSLGVGVGWRRVGITGDMGHVDLVGQPGGRESADVTVTYAGNRLSGRVKGVVDRPLGDGIAAIEPERSYSLDLGGSYRLTRRLDLTAGVRYRADRDRMLRLDDDRHDSQAVYVGTAFKF